MSGILELTIERPVAGGRMLARHDGQVVFVAGAIPGERVRARVERTSRQSLWAHTIEVLEASPDRREPHCDPACGGLAFAHIVPARQVALKSQILTDAFRRLARIEIALPPVVAASPEAGYRVRARLHARGGRLGFFREGTHQICDAAATAQLLPEATDAAVAVFGALGPRAADCDAVVVSENITGSERVLHLEPREAARLDDVAAAFAGAPGSGWPGITGITTLVRGRLTTLAGRDAVSDTAETLLGAASSVAPGARWTRRPTSFFQGNRFLTGALVARVLDLAPGDRCADVFAGVGLFTVAMAARGSQVWAVEGDPSSVQDLADNAAPWGSAITITAGAVEEAARGRPPQQLDAIVLDPPRTGVAAAAVEGIAAWRVPRLVYVSCDPPTLARDAARLAPHGYALAGLDGFDLFPNTPHVEAVAVFELR